VETSSSLAKTFQAEPVVYVKERVSGLEPEAGVKFEVESPGFTTRLAGGFEIESVTGIERLPTFGTVVTDKVALKLPGGRLVGLAMTLIARGAWPEDGATVSQPAWVSGVPVGYVGETAMTVTPEAVAGSETVSLVAAGNVVLLTV
jgi:hypothetical protein